MTTFLSIVLVISSVVLIVSVMMQESQQAGLGTLDGSSTESLWGANRGTSKKEVLKRTTIISSVIFFIATLALGAL